MSDGPRSDPPPADPEQTLHLPPGSSHPAQPAAPAEQSQRRVDTALASLPGLTIEGKLGEGGMGAVYRARQKSLNRSVAVKVLPAHMVQDRSFLARLEREGKLLAQIHHPNVIACFDMGEHEGMRYVVMEFVDGMSLASLIEERGRLPLREALYVIKQAVQGLDHAHAKGVIHRDVKPDNLLLAKQVNTGTTVVGPLPYTVKIADLGLAHSVAESDQTQITQQGSIMGSPHYMSPEQTLGERDLDFRTDLFALGCVLYQMLSGERPYAATTVGAVLAKKLTEQMPDPRERVPELPPGVSLLLQRMTARDKADRYASYGALLQDLEAVEHGGMPAAAVLPEDKACLKLSASTSVALPGGSVAARAAAGSSGTPGRGMVFGIATIGGALTLAVLVYFFYLQAQTSGAEVDSGRGSPTPVPPAVPGPKPAPSTPAVANAPPAQAEVLRLIQNRSAEGWTYTGFHPNLPYNGELDALSFDPAADWQHAERSIPKTLAMLEAEMTIPASAAACEMQFQFEPGGGWVALGVRYPEGARPTAYLVRRDEKLAQAGALLAEVKDIDLDAWVRLRVDFTDWNRADFYIGGTKVGSSTLEGAKDAPRTLRLSVQDGGGQIRNVLLMPLPRERAP
ncbi:MAG: serine/threonine protein kinase [Planctomycetes bacterium]|nr:serine/threonine protein kinase [Planctomycetota bacterium]